MCYQKYTHQIQSETKMDSLKVNGKNIYHENRN